MLAGSPVNSTVPLGVVTASAANPSAVQGGLITFDCDYQPANDAVRTRPALVQNVYISNVTAGNVTVGGDGFVLPGNRRAGARRIRLQRSRADARHCAHFGLHDHELQSRHARLQRHGQRDDARRDLRDNVNAIALSNVTVGAAVYNTSVVDSR